MSCHCDLLPHDQLLRLILPFLLLALAPHALAQPAANNFPPLPELLQYQASKSKQARAGLLSANMPCDGCACQRLSPPPTTIYGATMSPCPTAHSKPPVRSTVS